MDEMVGPDTRDWPDTDEERGFRMDFAPPVPCYARTLLEATVKATRFASQSRENGGHGGDGAPSSAQGTDRDPAGSAARGGSLIKPLHTIRNNESSNKRRATETTMTRADSFCHQVTANSDRDGQTVA